MRLRILVCLGGFMVSGGISHASGEAALLPIPSQDWRLVSDGVMGGLSTGEMRVERHGSRQAICLAGEVRTENNGGFVQIALDLDARLVAAGADYDGISLDVLGNGEQYNMHLRTSDLWLPWQSYRAVFTGSAQWRTVRLPFSEFEPYRTGSALRTKKLRRIGIVAIGRAFAADICVANLAFFRDRPDG